MLFKAFLTIGFSLFVIGTLIKSTHQNLTKDQENQTNRTTNNTVEELDAIGFDEPLGEVNLTQPNNTLQNNFTDPENPHQNSTRNDSSPSPAADEMIKTSYKQLKETLESLKYKYLLGKLTESRNLTRNISSFSLPRNLTEEGCLKLDFLMKIVISYPTQTNQTLEAEFNLDSNNYEGECSESMNKIEITVDMLNWTIVMEYTKDDNSFYMLSYMSLDYNVVNELFQNVSDSFIGLRNASTPKGFSRFQGLIGNSFECNQASYVTLDDNVKFVFDYYHAQPFNKKRSFDTAIICGQDDHDFALKFPLIIGAGLILTVVVILVVYKYFNYPRGFERLRLEPVNSRYM